MTALIELAIANDVNVKFLSISFKIMTKPGYPSEGE